MVEVSVIIPVYRSADDSFFQTLNILLQKEEILEILVGIDCPEENFLKKLNEIKNNKIIIDVSYQRRGKANTVNYLAEKARGEYLFILDADVVIKEIDFDVVLKDNPDLVILLPCGVEDYIDRYIAFCYNMFNMYAKRPFVLWGCCFIIKREVFLKHKFKRVVAEDFWLATEIAINGYKITKHCIYADVRSPKNIVKLLKRFLRWGYGFWEWLFGNWKYILKLAKNNIKAIAITYGVLAYLPSIPMTFVSLMMVGAIAYSMWYVPPILMLCVYMYLQQYFRKYNINISFTDYVVYTTVLNTVLFWIYVFSLICYVIRIKPFDWVT